jgi:Polyketide cyclase / dehydrase and lipid transport
MIEFTSTARYDLPATAIFEVLSDIPGYPAWNEAVESAILMDDTLRAGARIRQIRREMGWRGEVNVTVAEFVPGELLTLATDAGGSKPAVRQSYQLTSEDNGCTLTYKLALDGVPKVFEPVVRAQLRRQIPRTLRRISQRAAAALA